MREIAETLKARLGERASKVSTREAPDWLVRAAGLVSFEARFLAADLGKLRTDASDKAQAILGRPLRTLEDAVAAAGENLSSATRCEPGGATGQVCDPASGGSRRLGVQP